MSLSIGRNLMMTVAKKSRNLIFYFKNNQIPIMHLIIANNFRLSSYVVEKRDKKTDKWERVQDFVSGTECVIPKLKEGHDYDFRVIAENQLGQSEPLETNQAVTAKNPFGNFLEKRLFQLKFFIKCILFNQMLLELQANRNAHLAQRITLKFHGVNRLMTVVRPSRATLSSARARPTRSGIV